MAYRSCCQRKHAGSIDFLSWSLPGLTRKSMRQRGEIRRVSMDPRAKPAGDETKSTGETHRDQSLGAEHVLERAKGDVGGGRNRPALRAHRYRRTVRSKPRSGLSCQEPERSGADARRGRRLPALGIELDCALSC